MRYSKRCYTKQVGQYQREKSKTTHVNEDIPRSNGDDADESSLHSHNTAVRRAN